MKYEINNPGGGDCGFYAFSIGLIEIIQNEHQLKKISPTFQKWMDKGLVGVDLEALLKIDLQRLRQEPNQYEEPLLSQLQMSLRSIVAEASKEDLKEKIQYEELLHAENLSEVEGSPIFGKFLELVKIYGAKGTSTRLPADLYKFNELALSPEVRALAQQTAIELAPQLIDTTFEQREAIENTYIKGVLIDDLNSRSSCILHGVDSIKKQGRWATHSDLNAVAAQLNVNLLVTDKVNGAVQAALPTVTLNNKNNAHWTTTVDLPDLQLRAAKKKEVKPSEIIKPIEHQVKAELIAVRELSSKEEQVLVATLSVQVHDDKIRPYKQHLKTLIQAASSQGLFSKVEDKIDIQDLDKAEANTDESDEDFALRLQEAEYRGSGLK